MDGEPGRHGTYMAYMLRLWQAGSRGGRPIWRASLEDPHTGERLAFGDIAALLAFLAEQTGALAKATGERAGSEPPGVTGSTGPSAGGKIPAERS